MLENDGDFGQGDGIGGGTFDAAEALRCAQNLARNLGWAVFPCREDKRPASPHGFKDASKDAAAITELWRRYPGPLIGVATGEMSRIAVLDLDVRHPEALRWWRDNESRLPATRAFRTRSGGVHLYFHHAPGVRCCTGRPVPGVDVRGDGGFIIYWHAAGYECLDHAPIAPWPAWLSTVIWPPPPPAARAAPPPASRASDDAAIGGILRAVASAREGNRNSATYWGASRLRERGLTRGEAEGLLLAATAAAGLDAAEARRTLASAWRGGR